MSKLEEKSIETRSLDSWEEYKSLISSELLVDEVLPVDGNAPAAQNSRYLFRGQGSESWNLISSFDRKFESLPDEDRDKMHEMLLKLFEDECVHYPLYERDANDRDRLIALAQHYGLPTRLLDWSDSPYIAAFYAFSDHLRVDQGKGINGHDSRVAIWILNREIRTYWAGERGVKIIDSKPLHNERQKRQSGWFTYATMTHRTLEDYVLAMGNERNALWKVTLPASDANRALKDLNFMRINARELFADLGGAAFNAFVRAVLS